MANGDKAQAAGMDVVLGTADRRLGYDEINKTRDYIADRTSAVTPVTKGGTGSTTAAAARSALGVTSENIPSGGGTVQGDLNYLADEVSKRAYTNHVHNALSDGGNYFRWDGSQWVSNAPVGFTNRLNVGGYFLAAGDAEVRGNVFVPNASAATGSWTVAYINGDGRLSKGTSSARYKDLLDDPDAGTLGDIWPTLRQYKMKGGDGKAILGYIAEEVAESEDLRRFAVFQTTRDPQGGWETTEVVDSIDFIQLLIAQTAQLNARVTALEAQVAGERN